jgi:octaprenyl-diphosphate synthase
MTLPVVLAYRRGSRADREFWTRTVARGELQGDDLKSAVERLEATGALGDTVARARHYGAMARDALAPLPDEPYKAALLDAVAFCLARAH